jgi:riboflavin kinase/FMN adenylyltransferase
MGLQVPDKAAIIGTFDGVHKGHVALIRALIDEANKRGLEPLAMTFDPPPSLYFNPHFNFLLSTSEDKIELLRSHGIKEVIVIDFSNVEKKEPEAFIQDELFGRGVRLVIVGQGFRFGHNRRGGVKTLKKTKGMDVIAIAKERMEAEPISATRIRELLLLGHIRRANALLGYDYWLKGKISKGLGRAGALLDTPTVNLEPCDPHKLVPPDGIYAVRFGIQRSPSVCYVGASPTFGDSKHKIEVHLLEGSPEKRKASIVYFVEKLRPDMKFDSLEALRKQVREDVAQARRVLSQS